MNKKKSAAGYVVSFIIIVLLIAFPAIAKMLGASNEVVKELFYTLLGIIGIIAINKIYGTDFKFRGKDVLKGIISASGLVFIPMILLTFIISYKQPDIPFLQALPSVLIAFVIAAGAGLSEEFILRGVLFNTFRYRFGEDRKSIVKAVIFSSVIFGLLHLINLIENPILVITTLSQVGYAIEIGIVLGCIYYITNNIWVCAIFHGLFDFAAFICGCFYSQHVDKVNRTEDTSILSGIISVAIWIIFVVIELILLHKEFKKRGIEN